MYFCVYIAPPLTGRCDIVNHEVVNCKTSLDNHTVTLTYNCSYDRGPPLPCMFNFLIHDYIVS